MVNDTYQPYQENTNQPEELKNEILRDRLGYEDVGFDAAKFTLAGFSLYIGQSLFASFISMIVTLIIKSTGNIPHEANIDTFSSLLGGMICVVLFFVVISKEVKYIFKKFLVGETWAKVLKYVGIMYGAIMVYSLFISLLGVQSSSANQDSINAMMFLTPFMTGLYVCILAPFIEELTFRFCFFRAIGRKNEKVAFWVIACIFAGIHLLMSIATGTFLADLSSFPVYLIGGIGLTYAYYKEKDIAVSIGTHFLYNTISFLLNLITIFCFI